MLATACTVIRSNGGLANISGQWLNDLLGCGSTIILISIALASILAAINVIPPAARQIMTDEMKANGLMLSAAFLYSGGVIGNGIWCSLKGAVSSR